MNNLIVYNGNYLDVNGKAYGAGDYGCNYPLLYNDGSPLLQQISFTEGETFAESSSDLTVLLGGSIENNNEPLYKWLFNDGGSVAKIKTILTPYSLELETPFAYATTTSSFYIVDYYAQPSVKQTYATDSGAGFTNSCVIYTKYGSSTIQVGGDPVPLGSDPVLVNIGGDFAAYALNIQYA